MKKFFESGFAISFLVLAYLVAHFHGYISGKGYDLPWYSCLIFTTAFFVLLVVYQAGHDAIKDNKKEGEE